MLTKLTDLTMPSSMMISSKPNPESFKHVLSVKLNNEKYLLRKQLVMAAILGHKLLHFLESSSKPPKFLYVEDELKEA